MTYKRYTGANNGSWSTSTNWSPGGVPTTNDEAAFENSLTVSGSGNICLDLIIINGVNLVLNFSGTTLSISRGFLNGGTVRASSGCVLNFSGTTYDAEIYSPGAVYGCDMRWSKETRGINSTSSINLFSDMTGAGTWTSSYGKITWNTGNWQMNGYTTQVRCFLTGVIGSGTRQWWMNGNLICRNSTATSDNSVTLSSPIDFMETTGRVTLDTVGQGTYKMTASACTNYATSLNWTFKGVGGTNTTAIPAGIHMKNLIIDGPSMSNSTWRVHDSITTIATSTGNVATTLYFYANGNTAVYDCSVNFSTASFEQYSGSNSVFDIRQSRATTNSLVQNGVTYYLNHSNGTGQTFNCNATGSTTYYIKVTGTANGTINCDGTYCVYYLGWSGNPFSQTCGAYTLNCRGNESSYYFDNITDNVSSPPTITCGYNNNSTTLTTNFYINGGTNLAGQFYHYGGTLNINGDQPIVGSFICGATPATSSRRINWNGRYIRVNNQARNANTNGTGFVQFRAATDTTVTSDMNIDDLSDGGIQMESTGTIEMGLWTAGSCPRIKLVALGTTQSIRAWANGGTNYIRSIEIKGPVYTSGSAVRLINPSARITWDEVGAAADFRQFYPFLASATGGYFVYGNTSSQTQDQYRLGALLVDNTLAGSNRTWDIDKAHIQVLIITKDTGTWNLNDVIASGNVQCNPDNYSVETAVTYNWNKVVKPSTTSGFTGYSNGDNFIAGGGENTVHNIQNTGINIAGNNLQCSSSSAVDGIGAITNINATVAGTGSIVVNTGSRVKIIGNYSIPSIDIKPTSGATTVAELEVLSNFTVTGQLYNSTGGSGNTAKLLFTNRTITFSGSAPITITTPIGANSDLSGSNMIITGSGQDRVLRLSDTTAVWGTITNAITFVPTVNGDGTGWLEIRAAQDTGVGTTINTLTSQNTNFTRGFKFIKPAAGNIRVNSANGMSGSKNNPSYIQGNAFAGYNPVLSWLVVKNSSVSTSNSTDWIGDDSIYYGTISGWTINAPYIYPPYLGFFRFY